MIIQYNRFGKNEKPLYVFNHTPQKQEIHEVDVNDLVNDAILDRLMNVTEDGVRRRDNYILNEPIDLKTSGNKTIIYRDNSKPKANYHTIADFKKEIEIQNRFNNLRLNTELPVDKRRKAVKQIAKGRQPNNSLEYEIDNKAELKQSKKN